MAAMLRVRGSYLLRTLPTSTGRTPLCAVSPGSICSTSLRPLSTSACWRKEGYVIENKKLGRPLSPSLKLLFKNPEPVWMLSIAHRVTGSILTPTVSILSIAYLTSQTNFAEFVTVLQPLYQTPAVWMTLKFLFAFPFTYHCLNGIRHLYWDTGRGFSMQYTYAAGFTALVLGAAAALALAMYSPGS